MVMSQVWKTFTPEQFFNDIKIPDSWNTVEEFADWYMGSKMPMMIPWDAEVRRVDDATTICLFRKPPYQVELYLIHPNKMVPEHTHPDLHVITMILGGGKICPKSKVGTSSLWGLASENLKDGEVHSGKLQDYGSQGYAILSFEKWPENVEMSSAAIRWKGYTAGPLQEALIESHYAGAVKESGYADVSGLVENSKR